MRSTAQTASLMQSYADRAMAELDRATGERDALRAADVFADIAEDDAMAGQIWRTSLRAHMAGQLFVRDVELPRTGLVKLARGDVQTFLDLPFEEAIRHFEARGVMSPEEFAALTDAERMKAFAVLRAISERMTERMKAQLDVAMQPQGPGLREFIRTFGDAVTAGDLPGGARGYLENVYRTTTAGSYNAGRFRQQTDPAVRSSGLLWRYVTAMDNRVRREHAALHGLVWPIGDEAALAVYPPNSYQCRCVVTVVEPRDVDPSMVGRAVDASAIVTEGFMGPPDDMGEA